jgi:hypothetical protein
VANTILDPSIITKEALRVLHGKLSFVGQCNRDYEDRFGNGDGATGKIGTTVYVRRPPRYTVRTNATYSANDHVETSMPLTVSSQYGIDVSFTSKELTMDLNEFSDVVLNPAMAQLAAKIEGDALAVAYKAINNYVGTTSTQMTFLQFAQGGQTLTENLTPFDGRKAFLTPQSKVNFLDATKGLFHDSDKIEDQYNDAIMGRTSGFTVYENTFIPSHTTGTFAGSALTTGTSWATTTTSNSFVASTGVPIDTANTGTILNAGDILTFGTVAAGLVEVHPETKVSLGRLKKFVVQSAVTFTTQANTYTATVTPGVMTGVGNAFQNVSLTKADTDNMTVTMFGVAATAYGQNIQMHRDAFAFATVPLIDVSKLGAWGARESMDGISMRLARQWGASNDTVSSRFDIFWGFAPLYPELAVRSFYAL